MVTVEQETNTGKRLGQEKNNETGKGKRQRKGKRQEERKKEEERHMEQKDRMSNFPIIVSPPSLPCCNFWGSRLAF